MIDYAQHLIKIDRLAKDAHDACLEKRWEAAKDMSNELAAESRLLYVAVNALQHQEDQAELQRTLTK